MKKFESFKNGTSHNCYKHFGCHKIGDHSYEFTVWAPHADYVAVVGDFNSWNPDAAPMKKVEDGIFTVKVKNVEEGQCYKYFIRNGYRTFYKADPYARHAELRPKTASLVYSDNYQWNDSVWHKTKKAPYNQPVNIYEVHAGSWRKHLDGRFYSYRDLAQNLVPYVKEMGYTHIEFMPLSEYPFDGSWGYQVTGYYAPTSRYGSPEDLKYLIDVCHQNGIGVILDWVPAHFCKDEHGLYEFDGASCYESWDQFRKEHKSWGTRIFDFGRNEVKSFLISNAHYWAKEFHVDGLRVDAVASMLYLDYDRAEGEWLPNCYGGKENFEAMDFFRQLSKSIFHRNSKFLLIAEESTAFPGVTRPVHNNGLGFNYKWNMGWMNDVLFYMQCDPMWKADHHFNLTFSMNYAYSENYILPLSHDEVVHLKGSMINKMAGNYDEKFALLKTLAGYQYSHPGKKLNFMGNELAQFNEWNENASLDWMLLDYPKHRSFRDYIKKLNVLYKQTPALYQNDQNWDGFQWIYADRAQDNLIAFCRHDFKGRTVFVVLNFSKNYYNNYGFNNVPAGDYKLMLNSNDPQWGGWGNNSPETIHSEGEIFLDVPPQTAIYYIKDKK